MSLDIRIEGDIQGALRISVAPNLCRGPRFLFGRRPQHGAGLLGIETGERQPSFGRNRWRRGGGSHDRPPRGRRRPGAACSCDGLALDFRSRCRRARRMVSQRPLRGVACRHQTERCQKTGTFQQPTCNSFHLSHLRPRPRPIHCRSPIWPHLSFRHVNMASSCAMPRPRHTYPWRRHPLIRRTTFSSFPSVDSGPPVKPGYNLRCPNVGTGVRFGAKSRRVRLDGGPIVGED